MNSTHTVDLYSLWEAKLTNHRNLRQEKYGDLYAALAGRGMSNSGSLPGKLYDIAIENLGELSQIFREMVQDGWAIDQDPSWAETQLAKYNEFSAKEKSLIDDEIANFLKFKAFTVTPQLATPGKSELELSNRVHAARLHVMVHQCIAEHERQARDRTREDIHRIRGHAVQVGTLVILIIAAGISFWTAKYARKNIELAEEANQRTQKLFVEADHPQIQATPYVIVEAKNKNSTLNFQYRELQRV